MTDTDDIDSGRLSENGDRGGRFLWRREGVNQGPVKRGFPSASTMREEARFTYIVRTFHN